MGGGPTCSFLSAPPCGGRRQRHGGEDVDRCRLFLSAPPCGGRHNHGRVPPEAYCESCFYPRPRAGGDLDQHGASSKEHITGFYPRPRAGGDQGPTVNAALHELDRFYPRPRAGGDPSRDARELLFSSAGRFYPRPRAGGDVLQRMG